FQLSCGFGELFRTACRYIQPSSTAPPGSGLFSTGLQLTFYPALVGTRDAHVFPVFRDRAASDLYTLRLEDAGDLLVGQRPGGIFFFDELLDAALEDQ